MVLGTTFVVITMIVTIFAVGIYLLKTDKRIMDLERKVKALEEDRLGGKNNDDTKE